MKKKEIDETDINYVVAVYKHFCPSLPKITKISDSRKRAIKSILKKFKKTEIEYVFQKAEASDFLREGAKGNGHDNWRANFDWLMKESNFVKVLDGNYDNRENKAHDNIKREEPSNLISRNKVPHFCIYTKPEDVEFLRIYAYKNGMSMRELSIKIITDFANHYSLPTKDEEEKFLEIMEDKIIYTFKSGKRSTKKEIENCEKFEFRINSITYKFISAYAYYNNITRRQALMVMLHKFKEKYGENSNDRQQVSKQKKKTGQITMREMLKQTFGFEPDTSFKICGLMDCANKHCNKCKYKGMSSEDFWNAPYEKCV